MRFFSLLATLGDQRLAIKDRLVFAKLAKRPHAGAVEEKRIAQALEDKGAELAQVSANSRSSREAVTLDQSKVGRVSRMDALQEQAMDNAIENRRRSAILRLDAALNRLKEGSYAYCLTRGHDIAQERLQIDPAATLCLSCAR
jgi:DnaK suppressor protein